MKLPSLLVQLAAELQPPLSVSYSLISTSYLLVGTECGSTADLSYGFRGPHHRRSCLPSLAAGPGADRLQGRCAEVHRSAPLYLGPLVPVADQPGRRTLRSGGTNRLMVPSVRRSTVGDRAFTVAGPHVWNTLPEEITTSQTLSTFHQQLKTWLFRKSYPDTII